MRNPSSRTAVNENPGDLSRCRIAIRASFSSMRKLLAGISDYGRMHSLNQIRRDLTDCSHKMRRIDDAGWVSAFGKLVSETGQYFSPKVRRSALYSSDQFTIPIAACRADALHSH